MRYILGPLINGIVAPGTPAAPVASLPNDPTVQAMGVDLPTNTAKLYLPPYDTATTNELQEIRIYHIQVANGIPVTPLPTTADAYVASKIPFSENSLVGLPRTVAGTPAVAPAPVPATPSPVATPAAPATPVSGGTVQVEAAAAPVATPAPAPASAPVTPAPAPALTWVGGPNGLNLRVPLLAPPHILAGSTYIGQSVLGLKQ